MERKKNFRKEFRDKYYVYYKENGSVKSPKLYRVCLGGTLILSICGLVLQLLYELKVFQNKHLLYWEAGMYLIAFIVMAIADSKYVFRNYKKQQLEKSLKAIDLTFEKLWHPKDIYHNEKCIDIFKVEYNKSFIHLLLKAINKTVTFFLTAIYICVSLVYSDVNGLKKNIIIIIILGIVIEYFAISIPRFSERVSSDYLYDRVCNAYRYYLAEKCVYGKTRKLLCATENTVEINTWCFRTVIAIVAIIFIVAVGYDYLNPELHQQYKMMDNLGTFVSCEITLSSVIISIFGFILSGLNARYMGVSTKAIAFRNFVFPFNAIRCLWIVIIADVMEMFMYLFGLQTATVWCSVVSIVTFMYFTNMVYDLMSKKSKIYLKIWKKLGENGNKLQERICERIREMLCGMGENYKTDNLYYIEDLITLFYVRENLIKKGKNIKFIDKMGRKVLKHNIKKQGSMFQKAWQDKWNHYTKKKESLKDAKSWCEKLMIKINN